MERALSCASLPLRRPLSSFSGFEVKGLGSTTTHVRLSRFTDALIQQNEPLPWDWGGGVVVSKLDRGASPQGASFERHLSHPSLISSLPTSNSGFPGTTPTETSLGHKANLQLKLSTSLWWSHASPFLQFENHSRPCLSPCLWTASRKLSIIGWNGSDPSTEPNDPLATHHGTGTHPGICSEEKTKLLLSTSTHCISLQGHTGNQGSLGERKWDPHVQLPQPQRKQRQVLQVTGPLTQRELQRQPIERPCSKSGRYLAQGDNVAQGPADKTSRKALEKSHSL